MASVAGRPDPSLAWESVRARIHWERSTAERSGVLARPDVGRAPRRWLPVVLGATAVAAAGTLIVWRVGGRDAAPAVAPAVAERATPVQGLVTLLRGDAQVDGLRGFDAFAHDVVAGSTLRTSDGDLAVQFGDGSAFEVGPHSELAVARFDDGGIELDVTGTVDVVVAPRRPGQRFVVHAGGRTVEVRGTQFRISRTGDVLDVRCSHGVVAVGDPGGEVVLERGQAVALVASAPTSGVAPRALSSDEQAQLVATTPHVLPAWRAPAVLRELSAPLRVASPTGGEVAAVRIDGHDYDAEGGELTVRVLSGRHLVETQPADGAAWRAGQWVEVGAVATALVAAADARPAMPPDARLADVDAAIRPNLRPRRTTLANAEASLAVCTRPLRKQGTLDTFAEVAITVDERGQVVAVDVVDTDLPDSAARCLETRIAAVDFGVGAAGTWRQRLTP